MYDYNTQKKNIFTVDGQNLLVKIRSNVAKLLLASGAFRMVFAFRDLGTYVAWDALACIDFMVEMGEIRMVHGDGNQHSIFIGRNS